MRRIYFIVALFLLVVSPSLYSQEITEKATDSSTSALIAVVRDMVTKTNVAETYDQDDNFSIVVQNFYFPKSGMADSVVKWRQFASSVRAKLGLPVGRILKRISESDSQPYIVWECEYPSLQARQEDVAQLDKSDEFKKVQDQMSTLLEKFDRSVWQILK